MTWTPTGGPMAGRWQKEGVRDRHEELLAADREIPIRLSRHSLTWAVDATLPGELPRLPGSGAMRGNRRPTKVEPDKKESAGRPGTPTERYGHQVWQPVSQAALPSIHAHGAA